MRILLADDHALFRDGISSLLEVAGFEVVGNAGDGQAAVAAALRLQPDVVLLDISMPVMTGLDALRQIKAALPATTVVMLTVSESDEDLIEAVQAGADGYLLKNVDGQEFLKLLHSLERGEAAMTSHTTTRLIKSLARQARQPDDPLENLTAGELELLRLVASGMSNKAAARALSLSESTIKYHMKNILQKLGVQNRTQAVSRAVAAGLIKPDPD